MEMRFAACQSSIVGLMDSNDDTIVRDDNRTAWTLREGEGHVVSAEGESATVRVEITNGVLFEHEQAIAYSGECERSFRSIVNTCSEGT